VLAASTGSHIQRRSYEALPLIWARQKRYMDSVTLSREGTMMSDTVGPRRAHEDQCETIKQPHHTLLPTMRIITCLQGAPTMTASHRVQRVQVSTNLERAARMRTSEHSAARR
jgi:hypothetical protein